MQSSAVIRLVLSIFVFTTISANAAFKAQLQGKSRGSTTWIAGNLQNWRDLDEIPCRVYLTGGPANNKVISVEFDRMQGKNPGIQDLYAFAPSANVVITSQPVLSAPANSPRWTYTFTIKLMDNKPGFVKFTAKLAAGAHLNGGSSVGMRGSPALGNLQVHKISPAAGIVDLTLFKSGPSEAAPGQTITYTLQYSNKASATAKAIGVQISDTLPALVTVIPASLGSGRVVSNTVVWTVNNLSPGVSGSLSYSVRVKADTSYGALFTNMAVITSCSSTQNNCKTVKAHKSVSRDGDEKCKNDDDDCEKVCPSEANPHDNRASVVTRVVFNRAPVANPDTYQGRENEPLPIPAPGVLANDTDLDNNPLTAILVSGPAHGTAVLSADGSFIYTPTANYSGEDTFTYKANDGMADSSATSVHILLLPKPPQNRPPAAVNDQYDVLQDSTLNVLAPGVLRNDTDADNNPLHSTLVSVPSHGSVILNANGSFAYVPAANYHGNDTFTYKANDGLADSAVATVLIRVLPKPIENSAPIAADDQYTMTTNSPLNVAAPGVLSNDTDADGNEMTAILVAGPAHGTLVFNANGSFQYTPVGGFTGTDTYTYRTSDGLTSSLPATVTIVIQGGGGTNDPRSNLGPIVHITNPTNGAVYIEGMDIPLVADASDPDGTVTNVSFFSDVTFLGEDDAAEYLLLLTDVPAGEYVFRATATDNSGATGISSPVSVTVLRNPPFASGEFRLNRQTGLFEQTVTITNPTPVDFPGVRLWIMNVRLGAAIWNATGYSGGVPYIDVPAIAAGGTGQLMIEYYTPDLRLAPVVSLLPEVR